MLHDKEPSKSIKTVKQNQLVNSCENKRFPNQHKQKQRVNTFYLIETQSYRKQ